MQCTVEPWKLGTPEGLWKTVLNSEVVLFLRSISMSWIGIGIGVAVLNSHVVPISQVVLKTGFTLLAMTYFYKMQFKFTFMTIWQIVTPNTFNWFPNIHQDTSLAHCTHTCNREVNNIQHGVSHSKIPLITMPPSCSLAMSSLKSSIFDHRPCTFKCDT